MPKKSSTKTPSKYAPKFHNGMYVKAYTLASDGLKGTALAKGLGTSLKFLKKWKARDQHFKEAIELGRASKKGVRSTGAFIDYVYERLPPKLQKLWDRMQAWEDEENGVLKIEAMLEKEGIYTRMHLFAHSLVTNNFNVSRACRDVNIGFDEFGKWVTLYPDFGRIIDHMKIMKKDFFESALVKLVDSGDSAATIFANKTMNRDRGYNEKVEVTVQGNITQTHLIDVGVLNLPIDVKKMILEAYRKYKEGLLNQAQTQTQTPPNTLEYKRVGNTAVPIDEVDEKEVA